jgi:hypothetical protein
MRATRCGPAEDKIVDKNGSGVKREREKVKMQTLDCLVDVGEKTYSSGRRMQLLMLFVFFIMKKGT